MFFLFPSLDNIQMTQRKSERKHFFTNLSIYFPPTAHRRLFQHIWISNQNCLTLKENYVQGHLSCHKLIWQFLNSLLEREPGEPSYVNIQTESVKSCWFLSRYIISIYSHHFFFLHFFKWHRLQIYIFAQFEEVGQWMLMGGGVACKHNYYPLLLKVTLTFHTRKYGFNSILFYTVRIKFK